MKITNVKASFVLCEAHKLDEDSSNYLYYSAGHVKILKSDIFTFTIMGSSNRFINITGCPSVEKVKYGIALFQEISCITAVTDIKINSISFSLKGRISVTDLLNVQMKCSGIFLVKRFPRFSGVCLKHTLMKISGNFFERSGKIMCMGAKNQRDILTFISDLERVGFSIQ